VTGSGRPQVRVFPDLETLSRGAAVFFSELSANVLAAQGKFTVALSGGATPRRFYSFLGENPFRRDISWKQVHFFWVDERCVSRDHPESNFKLFADTVFSHVDVPDKNIHRIKGEIGPDQAAQEYEQEIRTFFGASSWPIFDLVVLGAGEDGHTASLFPGGETLREYDRVAIPVHLEPPKLNRVTLTIPVLNHATQVLFLASGPAKSGVVREILENGNQKQYPAGIVHPVRGSITWLVDRAAAGLLTGNYP
jgi:6-phosphogluconolactonase